MRILIDTREQLPYRFERHQAETIPAALLCGDYSLPGFQDRVAVEHKELGDLIGCLAVGRDRFERELYKSRHHDLFAVIVEATLEDVVNGGYRSQMKPQAALQSILAFSVRYRAPFVWAGRREAAEAVTFGLLQKYLGEIEKRFRRAPTRKYPKA